MAPRWAPFTRVRAWGARSAPGAPARARAPRSPALPRPSAVLLSSLLAGVCSALVSLPADLVKTRLQSQSAAAPLYSGFGDCVRTTLRKEGALAFWAGAGPYVARIAPHAVITLLCAPVLTGALLLK